MRTVEVKGTGESADAARKDAARLAIQKVVGVFIDNRRRIELNISDAKVSEVVNEKLISYTNGYVSEMEIIRAEVRDGIYEVTARVGVSVAPLLRVLNDNAVPTVAFDAATEASKAETLGERKAGTIALYTDLVEKVDSLVRVGVGTPQVDPTLPSSPDQAWLRIPLTYSIDEETMREWRTKFELFAQKKSEVFFEVVEQQSEQSDCKFPYFAIGFGPFDDSGRRGFLRETPPPRHHGVAACFAGYGAPGGVMAECLGHAFLSDEQLNTCRPGAPCYRFFKRAAQVRLSVELLDRAGNIIYAVPRSFKNWPAINVQVSRPYPQENGNTFDNFCIAPQSPFFNGGGTPFGDLILFPSQGSRIREYLNIRLSNSAISRISTVRARVTRDPATR